MFSCRDINMQFAWRCLLPECMSGFHLVVILRAVSLAIRETWIHNNLKELFATRVAPSTKVGHWAADHTELCIRLLATSYPVQLRSSTRRSFRVIHKTQEAVEESWSDLKRNVPF